MHVECSRPSQPGNSIAQCRSAEGRQITILMMPSILLLTLWMALCLEWCMAKALAMTHYDVALANQNRNISVSSTGPQPWPHSSPRAVNRVLNDCLDRQRPGWRSLTDSEYPKWSQRCSAGSSGLVCPSKIKWHIYVGVMLGIKGD